MIMHDNQPLAGRWSRRVCWLVRPTSYDMEHMPEHFTLAYALTQRTDHIRNRPPQVVAWSLDREEIAEESKQMYLCHVEHEIHTEWYDPLGMRVNKTAYVKAQTFAIEHGTNLQQIDREVATELLRRFRETCPDPWSMFNQSVSRMIRPNDHQTKVYEMSETNVYTRISERLKGPIA